MISTKLHSSFKAVGANHTTVCIPADPLSFYSHFDIDIKTKTDDALKRQFGVFEKVLQRLAGSYGDCHEERRVVGAMYSRDCRSAYQRSRIKNLWPSGPDAPTFQRACETGWSYMFPNSMKSIVLAEAYARIDSEISRIWRLGEWAESLRDSAYKEQQRRIHECAISAPPNSPVDPEMFDMSGFFAGAKDSVIKLFEELGTSFVQNFHLVNICFSVIMLGIGVKYLSKLTFSRKVVVHIIARLLFCLVSVWMARLATSAGNKRVARDLKHAYDSQDRTGFLKICSTFCSSEQLSVVNGWFEDSWSEDFKELLNRARPVVEEPDDEDISSKIVLEPQIGGGQAAFVACAAAFLLQKVPLYRAVVDSDKLNRNLGALYCDSVGAFESVLNTLLKAFGQKQVILINAHLRVVGDWELSVRSFVNKVRLGSVSPTNASSQMEYDRHRDQGVALEHEHKDPQSRVIIKRGMDALSSVSCFFAIRGECSSRMEPLVFCMSGDAGCGKTTLARMISANLSKYICSEDEISAVGGDLSKLCFQKGTSEYWEGYCGQPICVMDDWLQAIPVTGIENEVVNLIRAANQWPYPLNMASLEMKGKVNFTSRAILMTTNCKNDYYVAQVVTCPQAVNRRLDMCFQVYVKPEFALNGYLDVNKLSAIKATSIQDYDCVWNFKPQDLSQGAAAAGDFSLSQIVAMMRRNYDRRVRSENNTRDFVSNFAELPVEEPVSKVCEVEPQIFGVDNCSLAMGAVCLGAVGAGCYGALRLRSKILEVSDSWGVFTGRARPILFAGFAFVSFELLKMIVLSFKIFFKCVGMLVKSVAQSLGLWKRKTVHPQLGGNDPVIDRVRKNMVPVYGVYRKGGAKIPLGFGLFLTRQHVVVPFHFMREVRSKVVSLYISDGVNEIDLSTCLVVREAPITAGGIRDFCILDVRRTFIGKRDIRCHFASKKIQKNTSPGYFVKPDNVAGVVIGSVSDLRTYSNILSERVSLMQHSGFTQKGDCGAVLVQRNVAELRRVCGIHVAGLDTGYYCPLYAEDMPDFAEPQAFCGFEEVEHVLPLHNNGVTGISKTSYSGFMVPPNGGPACLRPSLNKEGVVVDPMISVVERSGRDLASIVLPTNTDMCISAVVGEIFDDIGDEDLSLLSYEAAVAGLEGDGFIKGIARGKSMGYPLCRKYPNKRPAFGHEGPYSFDSPAAQEVRADYETLISDYMAGKRSAVFRDCLKDEVLKAEKVNNVDTRLISASPVHFTILVKRLFGRFAAQFMRKRLRHGGLVGVNVYSPEWSVVSHDLRSMNKDSLAAAGDYKAYDKSQHPYILKGILMSIAKRLPHFEEMRKLFEGVALDTAEALHLGGDCYKSWVIYKIVGSLPSGHPLTSILNSIYNLVVFRMCWCDKYGDMEVSTFRDKVRCYVYGDDNIFAPDDNHLDFNLEAMASFCPKIGMVYTSEDKTGDLYKLKPVGSCSFLKRKFALDPDGYVYAPLEYHSIGDMLNWRKRKTTDEEHLEQVSVAMIRELAAYDFGTFQNDLGKLRLLFRQVGVRDPTRGIDDEYAYHIARGWYRGYTPVWSIDE